MLCSSGLIASLAGSYQPVPTDSKSSNAVPKGGESYTSADGNYVRGREYDNDSDNGDFDDSRKEIGVWLSKKESTDLSLIAPKKRHTGS